MRYTIQIQFHGDEAQPPILAYEHSETVFVDDTEASFLNGSGLMMRRLKEGTDSLRGQIGQIARSFQEEI